MFLVIYLLLFFFLGLGIIYLVDLDCVKVVRGINFFCCMFFLDENSGDKLYIINGVLNVMK